MDRLADARMEWVRSGAPLPHGFTRYHRGVSKTSVDVDRDIAREAAEILGTRTLRATIDAALREVVHAKRRLELIALFSEEGRFDFEAVEHAWGSSE